MKKEQNLPRAIESQRGAMGLTLIELGFVIVILAVIVALVLGFYTTLSRNKQVTDVVTDVANIRQAVSSWAGGLPLTLVTLGKNGAGEDVTRAALVGWADLVNVLSGRLAVLAASSNASGFDLNQANAWGSTYTIAARSYEWDLIINEVPAELVDRLRDRLATSGTIAEGAAAAGGASDADAAQPRTITLTFDVGG